MTWRRFAVGLFALAILAADDLPPGVILLRRIKQHMREDVARLPDYTCLETSERMRKPAAKKALKSVDTVRLEVLYTGQHELYAAPGDLDFREDNPFAFTAGGLSASGLFASFLTTLFVNDNGLFTWRGNEDLAGWHAIRYDFRVPLLTSGWQMQVGDVRDNVAMKGSIWVDPDSLDLLRLRVEADEVPVTMALVETSIVIEYARTRIGDADVLLPQTGELAMIHKSGEESRNQLEYTHCRSFQAQSSLKFDDAPASAAPAPARATAPRAPERVSMLPAGLDVSIKLAGEITDRDSIGKAVEGIVANNVMEKSKIVIPAGAQVKGRIRRLERHDESGGYFTFGIEFTEVRTASAAYRFYADLREMETRPDVGWALTDNGSVAMVRERITGTDLPGVGTFLIRGKRFSLPEGFRLSWKTRPLTR